MEDNYGAERDRWHPFMANLYNFEKVIKKRGDL